MMILGAMLWNMQNDGRLQDLHGKADATVVAERDSGDALNSLDLSAGNARLWIESGSSKQLRQKPRQI
jgi:hypothetical protein